MTYADNASPALGMSRNEGDAPATTPHAHALPPQRTHQLTITVYDVCAEHGRHTDPELHRTDIDRGI